MQVSAHTAQSCYLSFTTIEDIVKRCDLYTGATYTSSILLQVTSNFRADVGQWFLMTVFYVSLVAACDKSYTYIQGLRFFWDLNNYNFSTTGFMTLF